MADILIESFDTDIGASGSTYTLTNDVVDTSNAFVRKITATDKATGLVGNLGNLGTNLVHCGVELTGTDTLTFYKNVANTQKVVGEVWRYTGASGGENEFIVRGTYAITLSPTVSSNTATITGLVNRNKAVPIYNGANSSSTSNAGYDNSTVAVHINASGQVVVSRQATDGTVIAYVTVVEFTGSAWSIGHGVSSNHDTSMETVTLNTDSTGTGGSTFDVGDWGTAMIIDASMEGDTVETGIADVLALIRPAAATTQVTFSVTEADANARNDGTGYIHVIKHANLNVNRDIIASIAEGNNTYGTIGFPSGTPTDKNLDQLSIEWFVSSNGTGIAHARARLTARITDATGTIQHWVHRSGNNVRVYYGVADLSSIVSASVFNQSWSFGSNIILGAV